MSVPKTLNICVVDNYDSFTYNLVQYLRELGAAVTVLRNDRPLAEFEGYDALVLSPGPGLPPEAGHLLAIIDRHLGRTPLLGVCLGMQALALHCGGTLRNLDRVFHGHATDILITDADAGMFRGVESPFAAGRYHSWVVQAGTLPPELLPTAADADGELMALRHRAFPAFGLQFHPESMMTPAGKTLLSNFLSAVTEFHHSTSEAYSS